MGNDIIPGTGRLDFGLAEHEYRPLIRNLESLGYKEGKDLFVAFYNWRRECLYCAKRYLIPKIEEVKELTNVKKVNLICHSMGGLVARAYIQSDLYRFDVNKLIMIGVPNKGAVNAYYFWSGGEIPYEHINENFFYRLLKESFIWIFKFLYGEYNEIRLLRSLFPSIQDLLPTYDYGDYLYYEDNNFRRFVPIDLMDAKNEFVNRINKSLYIFRKYNIRVYNIIGTEIETNNLLYIDRQWKDKEKWFDGKPLKSEKTHWGDGTVTVSSARGIYGRKIYLKGDHIDILKGSKEALSKIFRRSSFPARIVEEENYTKYSSIIAQNVHTIQLSLNETKINVYRGIYSADKRVMVRQIGLNNYWIVIKLKDRDKLNVSFIPYNIKGSDIVVLSSERNKPVKMVNKVIKNHYTMKLQ